MDIGALHTWVKRPMRKYDHTQKKIALEKKKKKKKHGCVYSLSM
jgi:hypothetical protein